MKVLVTGCSGRLGGALVGALLSHPLVRGVAGSDVRPPSRAEGDRFRYFPADIRDGVYLRNVMEESEIDVVYHLAFKSGEDADPLDAATVNVDGPLAVLEAAHKARRVRKLVLLSSAYAYGAKRRNPPRLSEERRLEARGNGPAAWRRRMEESVSRMLPDLRQDLQVSFLRACAIAGGGDESACPALPFLRSPWGSLTPALADPQLQFLALEEAVQAMVRILEVSDFRGPYNLAPEDGVPLGTLCRRLGAPRLRLPYPLLWLLAGAARRLRPRLGLSAGAAAYLLHGVAVDNRRIKQALGIELRTRSEDAFAGAYCRQ
ncbi:MAG: NAD-dependent epimerase/dehydratase family protein [Elusimicrobia bacterium]|nr:NAD-dependent epimerase/dehydratase family protein [Elusimicrobiota bacterium]